MAAKKKTTRNRPEPKKKSAPKKKPAAKKPATKKKVTVATKKKAAPSRGAKKPAGRKVAPRTTKRPSAKRPAAKKKVVVARRGVANPEGLELAKAIAAAANDKKASDIMLLDVRALTAVTDYFIICSGQSERQLGAIADGIAEVVKEGGTLPLGREGGANAHWVLLDFGAAIVHVMAPPEREFYQLEKLWADATLLLHVQ